MRSIKFKLHQIIAPGLMVLYLGIFMTFGINNELILSRAVPIPDGLLEDFTYYERAMMDAREGYDPYRVLQIGPGYLYPPPAMFFAEIFSSIKPTFFKIAIFATSNILLLMGMVYFVARRYGYSIGKIWYWFPICLGFAPFLEILHIGQINTFTVLGILLMFLWTERLTFLGGFGWAIAILTKVTPVYYFPYLLAGKRWRVILSAIGFMILISGLAILRYGVETFLEYPAIFRWLTTQYPLDTVSQSLVAKLVGLKGILSFLPGSNSLLNSILDVLAVRYSLIQRILIVYLLLIIVISNGLFFAGRQDKEPAFIITSIGMMLSPNVIWYHHYVFAMFPMLIWMAWSKLDWRVITWCLIGFLVVQIDRWSPPYGLFIHIYFHITILALLSLQIRNILLSRRKKVDQEML